MSESSTGLSRRVPLLLVALSLLAGIVFPCANMLVVYPRFRQLLVDDAKDQALRIATHAEESLFAGGGDVRRAAAQPVLRREVDQIVAGFRLLKLKVFDATGSVVFSTDPGDVGSVNRQGYFREFVRAGKPYARFVGRREATLDEPVSSADGVETFVPVMRSGRFIGAIEVFYDVTAQKAKLDQFALHASVAMFGTAFLLLAVLGVVAFRMVRARRDLEESRRWLASILDAAPAAIVVSDHTSGAILDINPAAESLLGAPRAALLGRPIARFLPEVRSAAGGASRRGCERTLTTAQGAQVQVFGTSATVGIGGRLQTVDSVVDLTSVKRAEDALVRAERLAAVGTLTAGIAHEFNNAHLIALASTQLALEQAAVPEAARRPLERAAWALERARTISEKLVGFSGGGASSKGLADLNRVAQQALALLEPEYRAGGIEVVTEFAPLPETLMDEAGVRQVVVNLLTNAAHALLDRPRPRVTVRTAREGGALTLAVIDNGCGIAPDALGKIFSPFHSTKGEYAAAGDPAARVRGSGLGLAVSHSIAVRHGGSIDVESEAGEGSCFTLRVPLVSRAVRERRRPAADAAPVHAAPQAARPARILLLDDEPDIRDLLRQFLEMSGHQVIDTADGAAAFECLRDVGADLALVDLQMPGMSGYAFLRLVRGLPPERRPQVFVVTGTLDAETVLREKGLDGVPIVTKPFGLRDLGARIDAALAAREGLAATG